MRRTASRSFARGPAAPARRKQLGALLTQQGKLSETALARALQRQSRLGRPLGEILQKQGALTRSDVVQGLARQADRVAIDLARHPAAAEASRGWSPLTLLSMGALPWRSVDGHLVWAVCSDEAMAEVQAALPHGSGPVTFALADRLQIEHEIARLFPRQLADFSRDRCPRHLSCRAWAAAGLHRRLAVFGLVAAGLTVLSPMGMLLAVLAWVTIFNTCTTLIRATALVESFRARPIAAPSGKGVVPLHSAAKDPVVSILIPLYRERGTLRHLIHSLDQSTYPKELLDVIFICEEDDAVTPLTLARIGLPPWCRVLVAPDDALRTKPRAMNYALEFCRGTIVGIYDAEDRPETDQLRKIATHLVRARPDVGAVQGYLDFYNTRRNWLARCFAIEYAIWFRVLLRGMERLGVPLPLGGTTVFFRRSALVAVGAWDAHNVTEDADLGMRLARFGYRTEMVETTTFEEANFRPLAWIRQRSRWLKGYAMTWATHMRSPVRLWQDLGPAGFFGFQILLLGGLTAYLSTPLFWVLWLGYLGQPLALFDIGPPGLWTAFFASMIIGQAVMLSAAIRAVWPRSRRHLILSIPTLLLYWPLGAAAAYRAVLEIFTKPFFWDKTEHGL